MKLSKTTIRFVEKERKLNKKEVEIERMLWDAAMYVSNRYYELKQKISNELKLGQIEQQLDDYLEGPGKMHVFCKDCGVSQNKWTNHAFSCTNCPSNEYRYAENINIEADNARASIDYALRSAAAAANQRHGFRNPWGETKGV